MLSVGSRQITSCASSTIGARAKTPGSGFSFGPSSSRGKKSSAEVVGEIDAVGPARELDHHGEPALHVARSEADDRIVLDAGGKVSLCRNGVGVAREQHERLARALRVEQRLAVREDQLERHRLLDVGGDCGLVPRLGRDVDQLERPLGQEGIEVGSGHNRRQ